VDQHGREVPKELYDVHIGDDDFCFKFKNPEAAKSGRYRVVLANAAGEGEAEVDANFIGKKRPRAGHSYQPLFQANLLRRDRWPPQTFWQTLAR